MSRASCDPSLVSIIATFGTPIIAQLVGGFGGLIDYRQWRTARNRLKFDLFDRRLQIYEETRNLLATRMAKGFLQVDTIIEFSRKVRVARWLFNAAMADYLRGLRVRQAK
jgi:hypothetical protein